LQTPVYLWLVQESQSGTCLYLSLPEAIRSESRPALLHWKLQHFTPACRTSIILILLSCFFCIPLCWISLETKNNCEWKSDVDFLYVIFNSIFLACRSRQTSIVLEKYFRFEISLLSNCRTSRVSGDSDIIT